MPKPTIEQLEAEKKKAAAELEKAMQKVGCCSSPPLNLENFIHPQQA